MHLNHHQEKIDFYQFNRQLTPYVLPLLQWLLPNGTLKNQEYVALNPTRCDRHLGSFRINTRTGKWADFATGDKGGDFISLWAYVRGINQTDAVRELQGFLSNV